MSGHLTDAELRAFGAGSLDGEALLNADDHLQGCDACRQRIAVLTGASAHVAEAVDRLSAPAEHLSDDDVQALVSGRLTPAAERAAAEHLAACEECAAQVDDLRQWIAVPTARVRPAWLAGAAAAALVVVALTPLLLRSHRSATVAPATAAPASLMSDPRVAAAIRDGVGKLPPGVEQLGGKEVLLGGPASRAPFDVIAPRGTAVVDDTPTFSWRPLHGARAYAVSVYDENGRLVQQGDPVGETRWTARAPLRRDRTYVWQVTATRDGGTLTAPAAPAQAARFHVVDADTATRLARAQRAHPDEHLALGLLYMDAGIVDAARRELLEVPRTDPNAGVAARSLSRLEQVRTE